MSVGLVVGVGARGGLQPTELVRLAIEEDVGQGDRTSEATIDAGQRSEARIVAKEPCTLSGVTMALEVFRQVDPELAARARAVDGDVLEDGAVVIDLSGSTRSILRGERVALNFVARLSGVATETTRYVAELEGTGVRVLDTRKTTPGWRVLEKAAVRHGGGTNHRMGLDDMILIKDNHVSAAGGVVEAVARARAANAGGLLIEVEVRTLEELALALPLGPDRIMLDNMAPPMLARAVAMARAAEDPGAARPELEASGNLTLHTVRAVAETGVDFVSVGALTHSLRAADFSLWIVE